jgi:hypothetical protein
MQPVLQILQDTTIVARSQPAERQPVRCGAGGIVGDAGKWVETAK